MNSTIQQSNIPASQSPLICPVCKAALLLEGRTARCANNHCFDLAKEGYLNLLLSHQRRSKTPGDDKAMIAARRRFFDSGAFEPVSGAVQKLICGLRPKADSLKPFCILDCGCGEGNLLGALSGLRFGVDVSKEAIRCAARRHKDATWIVANGMRELPFAADSMDVILSVLAPRNNGEFARILNPDGKLILGVPGPNHLMELRTLLNANAGDFEEKADEAAAKCAPLFKEKNRELLSYQQTLSKEQIADLIQMTPIFWTSASEAKERVSELTGINVTVSFALQTFAMPAR